MKIMYAVDSYFVDKNIDKITISGWAFLPGKVKEQVSIRVCGIDEYTIKRESRPDVKDHYSKGKFKCTSSKNIGFTIELKYNDKFKLEFSNGESKEIKTINIKKMIRIGKIKKLLFILRSLSLSKILSGLRFIRRNGFKAFIKELKNFSKNPQKVIKYSEWLKNHTATQKELEIQKNTKFKFNPKISVVVPTYNTPEVYLREMIDSVINQTYSNWELCIADGASSNEKTIQVLKEYERKETRIKVTYLPENLMISENSNKAIESSSGEFIALLDHDDVLIETALFEIVKTLNEFPSIDIIYTDEDRIDEKNKRKSPFFKPDWSPDLLNSQMYICHLLCFKRSIFDTVGGFRKEFDGSQDYDLMLRMSRETEKIHHIPKILYSWRELSTSTSVNPNSKPYAHLAGLRALSDHLNIKYNGRAYAQESEYLFVYKARFEINESTKASIIIPTKDKVELTRNCVDSILEKTKSIDYEIIILNNNSTEEETITWFQEIEQKHKNIRVVDAPYEFNWSKLNNHGIREATGNVFVFLNNDTIVISENWLRSLAENALRQDVGTVGALLLYEDETIQHSGVVVGMNHFADHIFKGLSPSHFFGPFISPVINRNVLASTGACLAISKEKIEQIGRFDENFIICGSDVEISLRARKHGLFNMLDANAKLYHLESKSRSTYIPKVDFKLSKTHYSYYLKNGDPYFNKNLDLHDTTPSLKGEKK